MNYLRRLISTLIDLAILHHNSEAKNQKSFHQLYNNSHFYFKFIVQFEFGRVNLAFHHSFKITFSHLNIFFV